MAIDRDEFLPDDTIKAPLGLAANMDVAAKSYDDVIEKTKSLKAASDKTSDSITDLNSVLAKLSQQEQQLVTLQNKHAVEVKKLTDTQVKQRKEIEALNQKLKEKKKLEEDNAKAVEALDNQTGGLISRYKALGKEMLALAASPWIAVVGGLIGTFFALKNATESYYKFTGEGEDRLAEKLSASEAALNVIRRRWAELGGTVDKSQKSQMGFWAGLVGVASVWFTGSTKTIQEMRKAAEDAVDNTRELDQLSEEIADHSIKRARDERHMAELQYKAKQKNLYTDQQIIGFLREEQSIRLGLIQDEQVFADRRVTAIENEIANRLGIEASQLRSMTLDERHANLQEVEYNKLAAAQAEVIRLSGAFFEQEKKNAGVISALLEGQRKEHEKINLEKKKTREEEEKEIQREAQSRFELNQKIAQAEIDFQNGVLTNFKANYKTKDEIAQDSLLLELELMQMAKDQQLLDWQEMLINGQVFVSAFGELFRSLLSRQVDDSEKSEEEKRKQKRKTAIFEKALALTQASINVALNATAVLANPIELIRVLALGATQLAVIATRPIPALFKGVRGFKGGVATVGELGRELVRLPDGGAFLTPNRTTAMNLPPGTDVVPHGETEDMIRRGEIRREDLLVGELRRLKHPDFVRMHDDVYQVRETKEGSRTYTRRRIHGS